MPSHYWASRGIHPVILPLTVHPSVHSRRDFRTRPLAAAVISSEGLYATKHTSAAQQRARRHIA